MGKARRTDRDACAAHVDFNFTFIITFLPIVTCPDLILFSYSADHEASYIGILFFDSKEELNQKAKWHFSISPEILLTRVICIPVSA